MKFLEDKINTLSLKDQRYRAGGACPYYIRLTTKYSLKLFRDELTRDSSYVRQKIAHRYGFGPHLFNKINFKGFFGFVTEHADTSPITKEELAVLDHKMRMVGWDSNFDYGVDFNVGKIAGRPVIIDFDDCSLGLEDR